MSANPQTVPYFRIARPFFDNPMAGGKETAYLLDSRYAPDRRDLVQGLLYLEQDLLEFFEFVEPADANLQVYSHRLFNLLLKASTEFETNAKAILIANGYSQKKNLTIADYYKLNRATRISEYLVHIPIWSGAKKILQPFGEWQMGHSLSWYRDYNSVKHHRSAEFSLATLENVCAAISSVAAIVFSQFHIQTFGPLRAVPWYGEENGIFSQSDRLFEIQPPQTWTVDEQYSFHWPTIATQASPFQQFTF